MNWFNILWWVMLMLYIPASVALIAIVLLQKGKGAGFAGAFGVGTGSDTVFGPRIARTLPQKLTYASAAVFMVLALSMSMIGGKISRGVAPELAPAAGEVTQQQVDQLFEEGAPAGTADPAAETEATDMPLVVQPPAETDEGAATAPATGTPVEGIDVVVEDTPAEAPASEAPATEAPVAEAPVAAPDSAEPAVETAPPVDEAAPAEAEAPAEEASAPAEEPAAQ